MYNNERECNKKQSRKTFDIDGIKQSRRIIPALKL